MKHLELPGPTWGRNAARRRSISFSVSSMFSVILSLSHRENDSLVQSTPGARISGSRGCSVLSKHSLQSACSPVRSRKQNPLAVVNRLGTSARGQLIADRQQDSGQGFHGGQEPACAAEVAASPRPQGFRSRQAPARQHGERGRPVREGCGRLWALHERGTADSVCVRHILPCRRKAALALPRARLASRHRGQGETGTARQRQVGADTRGRERSGWAQHAWRGGGHTLLVRG